MNPSLSEFRDRYRELLLKLLWRQWSALGVAGQARIEDPRVIDPEALLLLTCTLGRHEPRLFDEVVDWLQTNGSLLNILRLKRMLHSEGFSGGQVLSALAGLLSRGAETLKWKNLAGSVQSPPAPEALFFARDGQPLPAIGTPEPRFARYGLTRGPLRLRGHSQSSRPTERTNLLLQLRALFGINVRCEIVLYLLTHETADPSQIARDGYFFVRAVQNALVEMSRSGIVQVRRSKRAKHYWIKTEHWTALLNRNEPLPTWVTWAPLFSALERIWLRLSDPALPGLDPLLQSSEVRQLMAEVRPKIERAGSDKILSDDRQYLGEEYLPVFVTDVERLVE